MRAALRTVVLGRVYSEGSTEDGGTTALGWLSLILRRRWPQRASRNIGLYFDKLTGRSGDISVYQSDRAGVTARSVRAGRTSVHDHKSDGTE